MSHVIAFISQTECVAFRSREDAPAGAMIFESADELKRGLTHEIMDRILMRLLGSTANVNRSPSGDVAAQRLWYVLSLGANVSLRMNFSAKLDNLGNRKIADNTPIELIHMTWVRGVDPLIDTFYRKLGSQPKKMAEILEDDGRRIWTGEEFTAVLLARGSELNTDQDYRKVINYHRVTLFNRKIIRRVSFAEFSAKPEFAGFTPTNIVSSE